MLNIVLLVILKDVMNKKKQVKHCILRKFITNFVCATSQ